MRYRRRRRSFRAALRSFIAPTLLAIAIAIVLAAASGFVLNLPIMTVNRSGECLKVDSHDPGHHCGNPPRIHLTRVIGG